MKKRRAAAVCAAILCFALVCSAAFIFVEAHHDCEGESCPVCAHFALCRDSLERLICFVCAVSALAALCAYVGSVIVRPSRGGSGTPVSAGVRLLI